MLVEGNVEVLDLATCTRIVCALELLSPLAAPDAMLSASEFACSVPATVDSCTYIVPLVFVPPMKPTLRRNHEKSA